MILSISDTAISATSHQSIHSFRFQLASLSTYSLLIFRQYMNMHGIKVATTLTGLTDHVIRVWEKRYNAVTPERTDTNRRLYSDTDISRLQNLSKLVKHGCAISNIAKLSDTELDALIESIAGTPAPPQAPEKTEQTNKFILAATDAIKKLDQNTLERVLDKAALQLGYSGLLEFIIIPVMQQVGEDWFNGLITTAAEHAATSFIKEYLTHSVRSFTADENAPLLVVTTPAGQLHDLSAYVGSCQARKAGWKVVYLGASLPANEIASSIASVNAAALLMSIVYPLDDSKLPGELIQLRKQCSDNLPILIGGSGLKNYSQPLSDINAITLSTISELAPQLQRIRDSRPLSALPLTEAQ